MEMNDQSSGDVSRLLMRIESGDTVAATELLPLVYEELRKLASAKLSKEKPGQTLQATALVHEAYLRLVDNTSSPSWNSRGHFFGAAAEAMRRILIEQARHKRAKKAGANFERGELPDIAVEASSDPIDLIALDDALRKLEQQHPRKAQLIMLRYYAGLTIDQAANSLGISCSTANADWSYAKSWLKLEMESMR
jgi:RNA polymerase sigma factor (TIGR02999 family)